MINEIAAGSAVKGLEDAAAVRTVVAPSAGSNVRFASDRHNFDTPRVGA